MESAFEITDSYVDDLCELSPTLATALGVDGRHDEWGDFGLEGVAATADLRRSYRELLAPHLDSQDFSQQLAARVAVGLIDENLAEVEAEDHFYDLRHMASSFQHLRSIFDVMPKDSEHDWENISRRLATIDRPFRQYRDLLDRGRRLGATVARRQVSSVVEQARRLGGDGSSYLLLLEEAGSHRTVAMENAVDHARRVTGEFGDWLLSEYISEAVDEDGVGEERYQRAADRLVGLTIDPLETYAWGWDEFGRLHSEMERVGQQIVPEATLLEVKDSLETDPSGTARSRDELVDFVKLVLEEAVSDLAGRHFDVPDIIKPLTVQIAPSGGPLGVSYMAPSEDFKRPGGVWYSVGDQQTFPLYQHRSTAYHEGFPGHHLQIAKRMYQRDSLSRAQRVLTWYPGYGEGWAMYAEVLMGELGYLDDPRSYFGMLAKQMYRAARIVVDIGLHLGLGIDETSPLHPGEPWTFERAVQFIEVYGFRTPAQAEAEVLRYLGWPGQAISYKVGEREILSIREETRDRLGPAFDMKEFHETLLNLGTMRLDLLRQVLRQRLG